MVRAMSPQRIQYRGVRRDGTAGTGDTTEPYERLVRRLYDQGWRRLVVTRNGHEIGWITKLIDGKRVWWI